MNVHALPSSAAAKPANGLPNEHYVDPGVFAEERQSVLFANWSGIGFGKDVPKPAMPARSSFSGCRS
jgi:choline monooxygenase